MAMLYTGHVTMTYPDYIDAITGKTLVCVPGQSYTIIPASGHTSSAGQAMPTDGRFTASSGREEVLNEIIIPDESIPENAAASGVTMQVTSTEEIKE